MAGDDSALPGVFPYRIVTLLGGDERSTTYLAQTLSGAPRYVALRVIASPEDPAAIISRFEQWKSALKAFRHSSMSVLFDAGLAGSRAVYAASEYVVGSPLVSLLDRGVLTIEERIDVAQQIAAGLDAAHAQGLAHLNVDASRVRIATGERLRAMLLGLGVGLVIDGAPGDPDVDRRGVAQLARRLGVATPKRI